MPQNLDKLIAKVEIVLSNKDAKGFEFVEIKQELTELTSDDRQLFLQKLETRAGGAELRDKACEWFEICAELDEMPDAPAPFDPSTLETTGLAGDPTTDPDDEA